MVPTNDQKFGRALWILVGAQHGAITAAQLRELGFSYDHIRRAVADRRLHPIWRGVYAVGRPQLDQLGYWMGAVLACGRGAVLSHESAAALWGIVEQRGSHIEVSIPAARRAARTGVVVHRRGVLRPDDVTRHRGIPVTTPACTLVDVAPRLSLARRERAVSEADKLDLIDAEALRRELDARAGRHGARALRAALDPHTFAVTDSELERLFLEIVRDAGLPKPLTGARVNGFKVDFFWPELGLVVETDGLRYHRTPQQQAKDRVRDQSLTAAGLTPLRFTRGQVRFDGRVVGGTVVAVARRLGAQMNF